MRSAAHAPVIAREHLDGLLLGDEHAQLLRDPRHRREPAADEHGEALPALVQRADERDAVDLGRVAAVGQAAIEYLCLRGRFEKSGLP